MEQDIYIFGTKLKNYITDGQFKEAEKFLNRVENVLENENVSATTTGDKLCSLYLNIFKWINTFRIFYIKNISRRI